ncbi:phospholipase C, phosphocholine-specific [Actinomadura barringtoniae]|uniref:phospholipase C n=1 Tax=Actinomadura barringtoniae TaxID=1427535 RepID=A0A939T4L6_9ACTN|nr:phospholipase C, phosphocholine-specific [Actinomadura barringtoniae]MBO2449558.1 phospholipase C, phosphocholine-specific [Actinomadura barringtoniae]
MTSVNRRRFLQLAGGTAAMTVLPESIARAAAIPASRRTGSIRDVEHIVVLMQENRAFDHFFGTMKGVRGFGDPRPVTIPSGKTVFHQPNGAGEVLPFHPDVDDLGMKYLTGLNHDWNGGHSAWNGGRYDNWIPAKTKYTMAYFERNDIPFHYALADAFTICDAYHCSFIGATDPNRYYMWTGYTGNDGKGGGPVLGNDEKGYGWTTYPERLEKAGVSWKIYQDSGIGLDGPGSWGWTDDAFIGNYGDNSLLYFNNYRNATAGNPLFDKARTGTTVKNGGTYFDVLKKDVAAGKLPQISWIAAPEAYSEHPNWPVNYGAWYIAQVLDALTANPDVWSKTVLLVTYDENDGFFDHVVPPYAPASAAQGLSTASTAGEIYAGGNGYSAGPYGLGPRVPMFAISPWSKGGWVNSQTFDHTSIIRFMEARFGVAEPNITPWRRAVCGDLTTAFDFSATPDPKPAPLPDTSHYIPPDKNRHPDYVPALPSPAMPKQEPGQRPARPIPYDLAVTGKADTATGRFHLTFASKGKAGAAFYITSGNRTDDPWTYTVEGGKSISDSWSTSGSAGVYDLLVYGPNGFFQYFHGNAKNAEPEVIIDRDGNSGDLHVVVANPGKEVREVSITDAYGRKSAATHTIKVGGRVRHAVSLRHSSSWYDLTVSSSDGFVRRMAGHIETGRPSLSDPALG